MGHGLIGLAGVQPFKMFGMNPRFIALLLCASLVPVVQAHAKTILPDACGDDSIKFDVKTEVAQAAPAPPPEGKAQVVLVESYPHEGIGTPTVRFGIDGSWAGANKGNSYFTLNVDPGAHKVCVALNKALQSMAKDYVDLASFTAEPGKVYYFEVKFGLIRDVGASVLTFGLAPLSEDEGKYRVKAWKLATWKTNK
jgi:hypothetical protein